MMVVVISAAGCGVRMAAVRSTPSDSGAATSTVAASPTVSPGTSQSQPTAIGPHQLTVADNGATVQLRRGQSLSVALAAQGMFLWHIPTVTGAALRQVSGSGGYPTSQQAQASFLATEPGTATLTAMNDTMCLHSQPACLPPQQEWRVTVLVR